MQAADIPVYVVHGPHLVERRRRLESDLERHGVCATWIDQFPASELPAALVRRHYRPNRLVWRRRTAATRRIPFRRLTAGEIAVAISHLEAYRLIANAGSDWGLVLEDDAILDSEFRTRLTGYLSQLPSDADLVFIGACCGLRIANSEPGRYFYRKDRPASRCAHAYLIHHQTARLLARSAPPVVVTIDWELSYHAARHKLIVYWLEPPLVEHGSETGAYKSSMSASIRS